MNDAERRERRRATYAKYRAAHRDIIRARKRLSRRPLTREQRLRHAACNASYHLRHRDRIARRRRELWAQHRDYKTAWHRAYRARNRSKVSEWSRGNYRRHRSARLAYARRYQAAHPEQYRRYARTTHDRGVQNLLPRYLRDLLHKSGRRRTARNINQKRKELLLCRSRVQFNLLAAGSSLPQAFKVSSTR